METTNHIPDALGAVRNLTLAEVERRLADLDAERAQLSSLRRSIVARERAKRRANRTAQTTKEGEVDALDLIDTLANPREQYRDAGRARGEREKEVRHPA